MLTLYTSDGFIIGQPTASRKNPPEAVAAFSCRGVTVNPRSGRATPKTNQDRGCVCASFGGDPKRTLFCVFDGHGSAGDHVAQYVVENLPKQLAEHPSLREDPGQSLHETFVAIDDALRKDKAISTKFSGTTATVCLCLQEADGVLIHSANAGDSRAILVASGQAIDLTDDHKPDRESERERITGTGGHVSAANAETGAVARVWLDGSEQLPGLAVARSLGDHVASRVGVYAEPEVTTRRVACRPGDEVTLVLGSDGVFESRRMVEHMPAPNGSQHRPRGGSHGAGRSCGTASGERG